VRRGVRGNRGRAFAGWFFQFFRTAKKNDRVGFRVSQGEGRGALASGVGGAAARSEGAGRGSAGRVGRTREGAVLPEGVNMENYVAQIERFLLQSALVQTNGVQIRAADLLGISYWFGI
jgi:hypothetical protein